VKISISRNLHVSALVNSVKYKRILIKISGEVLQGTQSFGIENEAVTRIVKELVEIHTQGVDIGLVIGGGNFFRGATSAVDGMKRFQADEIGMLATVQNAIVLHAKLDEYHVHSEIFTAKPVNNIGGCFTAEGAQSALRAGKICVFAGGTGNPYFTTDTAAVLRALEIEADILLKGTKVDGVYDRDPVKFPDATIFRSITYKDYIQLNLKVLDLTAISLAKNHNLKIRVFNIREKGNILKAVSEDNFGSIIE